MSGGPAASPAAHPAWFGRCGGVCRWLSAAAAIAAVASIPVVALLAIATRGSGDSWRHLIVNVLPRAAPETALFLVGVGALVIAIGTAAAWLVVAYDFPGRRTLEWALLLPLAVPTYVVAFAYLDVLHPIGPVQSALRALLGIDSPQGLRLPDIRSLPGAIVLLGLVLYPYVYLSTRAMFVMQAGRLVDAARTLGADRWRVFLGIALPLARPAIAVGASLALMETLNDVGASEFLGVQTLTLAVYSTWINRSDLAGAAGLALFMLVIVLMLVLAERWARRHQAYASTTQSSHPAARIRIEGVGGWGLLAVGALPVVLGFAVPVAYLAVAAWQRISFAGISADIVHEAWTTLRFAAIATIVATSLAIVLAYAARIDRGALGKSLLRVASLGYALPGTVLAIGLLVPVAAIDNLLGDAVRALTSASIGLFLSGTGAALVFGYVVRFLAVSAGGVESGFAKVPLSLDGSARTLGRTAGGTLLAVHLPIVRPALAAAAALVFVECMKELPLTLLLRPLNVETLATHVFAEASRGTYEEGAIAALAIVIVGLVPVILLSHLSGRFRLAG